MKDSTPKIVYRYLFRIDGSDRHEMGIEYEDSSGRRGLLRAPPSWQFRPTALRDELANADAQGDISPAALQQLLATGPVERRLLARRTGWFGDEYVLPYLTINPGTAGALHEASFHADTTAWTSGTNRAWKEGLRPICEASDFAVFAVAFGLSAAILSYFTPAHGLLMNLGGPSGGGKTTMLRIAQSVLKRVEEEDIASANMTPTGLEEHAAENNDLIACADEFGALMANEKEVAAFAKALSYRIRQGQGRRRSRAARATLGYDQLKFRTCMMTSSEMPLAMLLGPRLAGEEVRLVDLLVPDKLDGGVLIRRGRKAPISVDANRMLIKQVEKALSENYGTAFPRFVSKLSEDQAHFRTRARNLCAMFVGRMIELGGVAPENARHLEVFGRIYAAGALAAELGIVPFDLQRLGLAMRGVYAQSELGVREVSKRLDEGIVNILRAASDPERSATLKKSHAHKVDLKSLDIVMRERKGETVLGVRPDAFHRMAKASGTPELIRELEREGILIRGPNGATRQLMVNGEKPYFFCLDGSRLIEVAQERQLST